MRRSRVAATTICLATAMAGAGPGSAALGAPDPGNTAPTSPNVIMILADDLGYDQVSVNGGPIATPNLDRLAEQGVRFTDGYVASTVCTPSRQAVMTGRHPSRHGGHSNRLARDLPERLPSPTIGNILDDRGYTTHAVGKWDLAGFAPRWGDPDVTLPHRAGFDSFYGSLRGMENYCSGQGTVWRSTGDGEYESFPNSTYMTDEYTANAEGFVRDHAGDADPFFLYLSYTAPHAPIQSPSSCPGNDVSPGAYADMVETMDAGIGRVLDALGSAAENTMVVFVSDHGAQHDQFFPSRLRDGKYSLFEGGIRVPFLMRWPAGLAGAPATYSEPVSTLDLLPTIAEATGRGVAGYPGRDVVPYVTGSQSGVPHDKLYWRYVEDEPVPTQGRVTTAIRSGDYKYLHRTAVDGTTEEFLFDLAADVGETNNLADDPDYAAVRERLVTEHQHWNAHNPLDETFEYPRPSGPRRGQPDGFISYGGTWSVVDTGGDHEYQAVPDTTAGRVMLAGSHYRDLSAGVDVRLADRGTAGVIVRDGYRVSLHAPRDPGQPERITLHKVVGGEDTEVRTLDRTVEPGVTYRLRVDVTGATISVFLDDQLQFRWTDPKPILGGAIGLTAADSTAYFDNLTAARATGVA